MHAFPCQVPVGKKAAVSAEQDVKLAVPDEDLDPSRADTFVEAKPVSGDDESDDEKPLVPGSVHLKKLQSFIASVDCTSL